MSEPILIIQGNPDPHDGHFGHALGAAYAQGAREAGREVIVVDVAKIDFPLLRTKEDFEHGDPPPAIREAQRLVDQARHLVIIYPLWLGGMPALLKGFFEQVLRPGFGFAADGDNAKGRMKKLTGKTARVVVTMGMPALVYRWYFRAHSLKSLKRNILGFCGIGPIRQSLIGMIETEDKTRRQKWLKRMQAFGRTGT